ncbi:hypothetical protein [Amycolatopsis sp. NPDC004378]
MTRFVVSVLAALLLGPAWVPPTASQLSAAVAAAHTPEAVGYARTNLRRPGQPEPAGISVADTGIPAYTLDPAFVRGETPAPAAVLAYVAVVTRTADGRTTTLQATPAVPGHPESGWHVGSALSGDDEARLAAGLHPGTVLLNEPQINGWYELGPDGVRLLRASLPQNPVGALVPLGEYQRQVHDRYADKQPQLAGPPPAPSAPRPWWLLGVVPVLAGVVVFVRRRRP